jgi:hypothetical protein
MRRNALAAVGGITALMSSFAAQAAVRPAPVNLSTPGAPLAGTRLGNNARSVAGSRNGSDLQGGAGFGFLLLAGVAAASAFGAYVLIRNHHGSTHNAHPVSPG